MASSSRAGTDTMEETAFFLQNVLDTDMPVVLVGSMRPSTAIGADGPANLYEAMRVAAVAESRGRGVLVVLNDTIHAARWVQKTNTTSVQTFRSPDAGPVGYVDTGPPRFLQPAITIKTAKLKLPDAPPLPRVDIVYSHANMDAAEVEDAVKRGAKGIVLAGVGDGNSSKGAIDALAAAAKQGVLVVRSTRVGSGYVNRNVEVEDDKLGFAVSLDLNPQKARAAAAPDRERGHRTHGGQRAFAQVIARRKVGTCIGLLLPLAGRAGVGSFREVTSRIQRPPRRIRRAIRPPRKRRGGKQRPLTYPRHRLTNCLSDNHEAPCISGSISAPRRSRPFSSTRRSAW